MNGWRHLPPRKAGSDPDRLPWRHAEIRTLFDPLANGSSSLAPAAALMAMCAEDMIAEWLDSLCLEGRVKVFSLYRHDRDHNDNYRAEVVKVLMSIAIK